MELYPKLYANALGCIRFYPYSGDDVLLQSRQSVSFRTPDLGFRSQRLTQAAHCGSRGRARQRQRTPPREIASTYDLCSSGYCARDCARGDARTGKPWTTISRAPMRALHTGDNFAKVQETHYLRFVPLIEIGVTVELSFGCQQ